MDSTISSKNDSKSPVKPSSTLKRAKLNVTSCSNKKLELNRKGKKKRIEACRSPLRILSPNSIHLNDSNNFSKCHSRRSSLSSIQNDDVFAPLSSDKRLELSTTFTFTEDKENEGNLNQTYPAGLNFGGRHTTNNTSKEIKTGQNFEIVTCRKDHPKKLANNKSLDDNGVKVCDNGPLGRTLDIFVNTRKRRENTFPSTGSEDMSTTLTTVDSEQKDELYGDMKADFGNNISFTSINIDHSNIGISKILNASTAEKVNFPLPYHYPTVECPGDDVLELFYNLSMNSSSFTMEKTAFKDVSHQFQLSWSKSGILSLEEVILPALCEEEMKSLKKQLSKAKRHEKNQRLETEFFQDSPFLKHTDIIDECRKTLNQCALSACDAAYNSRIENENDIKLKLKVKKKKLKREKKQMYEEKKQMIMKKKAVQKEMQRRKRKKNLSKNKENWREVAKLMTDLSKIQKDQKIWYDSKVDLVTRTSEIQVMEEEITKPLNVEITNENTNSIRENISKEVNNMIQDLTLASDRINKALIEVLSTMREGENAKNELYKNYVVDHQFDGYCGVKNPKGLIQVLAMEK